MLNVTDMSDGPYFGNRRRRDRPVEHHHVFPSVDEIAERAYELFVAGGRRVDSKLDCWRRAEDELLELAARRVTGR